MKQLALVLSLLAAPAFADTPVVPPATDTDLIEQGAEMLLRGLLGHIEPKMKEMGDAFAEMQPKFQELMAMVDDIRNYHAPERLPNGDILIRRKTPAELKLEGLNGPQTDL
jgi:hypothetical protein